MKNILITMIAMVVAIQLFGTGNIATTFSNDIQTISSQERFVNRLVEKQLFLENMRMEKNFLFGASSQEKFMTRLEAKGEALKKMAFSSEEIFGTKNPIVSKQIPSNEAYVTRLENKVTSMVSAR